jgi:alpha-tubulin suppressor-like RCC1 family protein
MRFKMLAGGLSIGTAAMLFAGPALACPVAPGQVEPLPSFGCTVFTTGYNNHGQLGDGTAVDKQSPVKFQLPASESATQVVIAGAGSGAAGAYGVHVRTSSGKVFSSGVNTHGQLGDGTTLLDRSAPVQFGLPAGEFASLVASGVASTYVITASGKLFAAGRNHKGQLGNGTTTNAPTPTLFQLPSGKSAARIFNGTEHVSVLTTDGELYSAGSNYFGQFGNGGTADSPMPSRFNLPAGEVIVDVLVGSDIMVVRTASGKVYGAGANTQGQLGYGSTLQTVVPTQFALPGGVTGVSMALEVGSVFVLGSNGRVYGAGFNGTGSLGDGTTSQRTSPVEFALPFAATAVAINSGPDRIYVLTSTGTIYVAGANGFGQLGIGTVENVLTPTLMSVPLGETAVAVYPATDAVFIRMASGQVYGAGINDFGHLGDGSTAIRSTLVRYGLPAGEKAVEINAALGYVFVTTEGGSTYGAGWNSAGNLGDGTTTNRSTPVRKLVGNTQRVRRVAAINSKHSFTYSLSCPASAALEVIKQSIGGAPRPANWTIKLTSSNCNVPAITVTIPGTDGAAKFTDIPVFAADGVTKCQYRAEEIPVAEWTPEYPANSVTLTECESTPYNITNRSPFPATTTTIVPPLPTRPGTTVPPGRLPETGSTPSTAGALSIGALMLGLGIAATTLTRRRTV